MTTYNVGDRFNSLRAELDNDEDGNDCITPAGSESRVVAIDGENCHIVCDASGAWIIPTVDELSAQFARL